MSQPVPSPDGTPTSIGPTPQGGPSPDGTPPPRYSPRVRDRPTPSGDGLVILPEPVKEEPEPQPQREGEVGGKIVKTYLKRQALNVKIKILYVVSNTGIGGAETVLKRLVKGLDKEIYDVDIAVTHEGKGALHEEYKAYSKNLFYAADFKISLEKLGEWLKDLTVKGKYDYIHIFNLWDLHNEIKQLSEASPKSKIVLNLHADFYGHKEDSQWKQWISQINLVKPLLLNIVTDSERNRNIWKDIQVIDNGIPVETFSPKAKDPNLFLWIGRMQNTKRPARFLELAERLPEYRFIMVGDSETEVSREFREKQPKNLEIKIGLKEREVADLLAEATYFLFTSMTESQPLTVLEAMSSECCVISEQVGDINKIITDNFTGYLIPKGKIDIAIWVSEQFKSFNVKIGEEARRTIIRNHQLDNMVKKYEHIYGLIGNHYNQIRIAFLWGWLPPFGITYWDTKIDSHQYAITRLSENNVVQVFVPIKGESHKKIINNQNISFYDHSNSGDLIEQIREFNPNMIFMNMFHDLRWNLVNKAFPETWKALVHFGSPQLKVEWAKNVNLFIMQQEFMAKRTAQINNVSSSKVSSLTFCVEQWLFKPLPVEKIYTGIMIADFRKDIKRQYLLIKAWQNIPGKLVLVGYFDRSLPVNYHEECKELAVKLGVYDRIIFIDGYSHVKLPELINKAKIGFLTSSHEGGSRSLLEQMACVPYDTQVKYPKLLKVHKRKFTGYLINIQTETKLLSLTPEHPVLSLKGWIQAKALKEGDIIYTIGAYQNGKEMDERRIGDITKSLPEENNIGVIDHTRSSKNVGTIKNERFETNKEYRLQNSFKEFQNIKNGFSLFSGNYRWRGNYNIERWTKGSWKKNCSSDTNIKQFFVANELFEGDPSRPEYISERKKQYERSIYDLHKWNYKRISPTKNINALFDFEETTCQNSIIMDEKFNENPPEIIKNIGIQGRITSLHKMVKLEAIKKIERNYATNIEVFNLTTLGNFYFANGILVHNCGLPNIVLNDCEGNVNMIIDRYDGLIAEPTSESIVEKANFLLEGDKYIEMGRRSSERIHRDYPYHKMSNQYREIVESTYPEVSIITTSMNRGRYIGKCIDSVKALKGAKVNHIIMDGGSKDNTLEILDKNKEFIHAFIGRDKGQTDAILRAVTIIEEQFPQTRYLGWINADDYYDPFWLEASLKALRDSPSDVAMVCGNADQVDENGVFLQRLNYTQEPYITLKLLCNRGNITIQPTVLIRFDAYRKIREVTGRGFDPDYHYCQDLELWTRFLKNGYKIMKINQVTAYLRSHSQQMSLTHQEKQVIERDRILRKLSEELGLPNPIWVKG